MTAGQKRRAAATARMIRKLPKTGALVIVHAHSAVAPIRDLITEQRGIDVARVTRIVAAPAEADEAAIAAGTVLPVHHEPFVLEQREHARAIRPYRSGPVEIAGPKWL